MIHVGGIRIKSVDIVYTEDYILPMRFEWHEEKNHLNRAEHGIWFEEAQTVWVDPAASEFVGSGKAEA